MKRVLVTGGASGLGRALALRYASAGWRVCITDIQHDMGAQVLAELHALGVDALFLPADVTSEQDMKQAALTIMATWGGLDLLINNAGVASAGPIEEMSLDDWRWAIDINLLGVVLGCKAFVPIFKRQGQGHIVNIASMAGLLDVGYMSAYNATKAAVVALSGTLEQELMDDGISVSVVCPSFFQTNLDKTFRSSHPGFKKTLSKLLTNGAMSAMQVAESVYGAVHKKTFMILPHADSRRLWLFKRVAPHAAYRSVLKAMTRKMAPRGGQATQAA